MSKKQEEVLVKDPVTDEILVPWGTMQDELIALGLINSNDQLINSEGNEND